MRRVVGRVAKLERTLDLRRGGPCACPNGAGVEIVYDEFEAQDASSWSACTSERRKRPSLPPCPKCGRERTHITVRYVPEGEMVQHPSS